MVENLDLLTEWNVCDQEETKEGSRRHIGQVFFFHNLKQCV